MPSTVEQKVFPKIITIYSKKGRKHELKCQNERIHDDENLISLGMTVALFSTYFTVISAKCALPSTFALLTAPNSGLSFSTASTSITSSATIAIGQQSMSKLLTLSTFSIALGKFFLGPIIDAIGGIRSLQISLTLLSTLLALISTTSSFYTFSMAWLLVDFIFSSCWAASLNAVHQSFPSKYWTTKVGMLASAARSGNTFAFAAFAFILNSNTMQMILSRCLNFLRQSNSIDLGKNGQNLDPAWRTIFLVASLLQIIPIFLLTCFGNKFASSSQNMTSSKINEQQQHQNSEIQQTSTFAIIEKLLRTPLFWLHLTSRTSLMIFGSFLLFVPTFMTHCYGLSSSQSAQVASVFSLGCLGSLVFGSKPYSNLSHKKKQSFVLTGMLFISTICAVCQWLHVSSFFPMVKLSPAIGTAIMFLWGLSFSIPFYLPPSLYALEKGGKSSSATIADIFDIGGFALLAFFNGYVGSIPHEIKNAWSTTFKLLILSSACSMISLNVASKM